MNTVKAPGLLHAERGSVLLVSLLMITLFPLVGGTFLILSNTEGRIATNQEKGAQALYVTESGAHIAYREFAATNFRGRTHEWDGTIATGSVLVPTVFDGPLVVDDANNNGLIDERNDGWLVWEWNPGDPDFLSLTDTGLPETFRFSIRPVSGAPDEDEYVIDVIGTSFTGTPGYTLLNIFRDTSPCSSLTPLLRYDSRNARTAMLNGSSSFPRFIRPSSSSS